MKSAPWNQPNPKRKASRGKLSDAEKLRARRYAKQAGRPYPNLIDNMRVIRERKDG